MWKLQLLGHLCVMWMRRSGMDLQLVDHLATQRTFWKHAFDGLANELLWLLVEQTAKRRLREATRVAGMTVSKGSLGLVRGHVDLCGIDDDDVVTCVYMRGKGALVLTSEQARRFRGQAAKD